MASQQGQAFEDLRNTVSECTRIVRHRWRLALVGLAMVGSAAFWCSQYLRREYTATTMFERRDDVVLQNLVQSNSPYGFGHLKATMTLDMTGLRALAKAMVTTGLLPAETFSSEGALTEHERAALDGALTRYKVRAAMRLVQSSSALDMVSLRCDANHPGIARQLVIALRDNYTADTRARIRGILRGTSEFFAGEVSRLEQEAALAELELRRGFEEFPGIDPTDLVGVGTRLEMLRAGRAELFQRKTEVEAQMAAREEFLKTAPGLYAELAAEPEKPQPDAPTSAPSPAVAALDGTIEGAQRQIFDLVTGQRMTLEHPSVKALSARLEALEDLRATLVEAALEASAADRPVASLSHSTKGSQGKADRQWQAQQMRVEMELKALRRQFDVADRQLAEAEGRLARFEALYARLLGQSEDIRQLLDEQDRRGGELATWQRYLAQLNRILVAEGGERGTQFSLIEEPQDVTRPTQPRAGSIFVVCSGLGLAAAALLIALAELFDRSFRSVGQVSRTLGVPVLECIGVIPTPRERRRTMVSRLIWTPTLGMLLLSLAASAALAYASLEMPSLHKRALHGVDRVFQGAGLASLSPSDAEGGVDPEASIDEPPVALGPDRPAQEVPAVTGDEHRDRDAAPR